jgi:hypothetical protein
MSWAKAVENRLLNHTVPAKQDERSERIECKVVRSLQLRFMDLSFIGLRAPPEYHFAKIAGGSKPGSCTIDCDPIN